MHQKGVAMKFSNVRPLGRYARLILHIELPITLGFALFFLFSYLKERATAPVFAELCDRLYRMGYVKIS